MSDPNLNPPPTPAAAVAPKPATPPLPPKPAATKPPAKGGTTRRGFLGSLSWIGTAWVTFSAGLGLMTLGTVRFLFPNVLSEPPSTFKVGDADSYEEGKVVDRFKDSSTWVVRNRDERGRDIIYALSTTCTHLGCTPNWLESEQKFKCPCHGSGFNITGINFEGPAPRPLERCAIRRRRRRPDRRRQEPQVPARTRPVGRSAIRTSCWRSLSRLN